ncbi:YkvA family protein [Maritalea sp.]|uniref:YkvA family protein n=1 Tax=Maritalea sp. TaxID=2003361 RepID=UPI003EF3BE04
MIVTRLIRFRREIVTLWHAFWNPLTPTYLKVLTVLTVLYVVSPLDLITDLIPVIGWVDDVIIVSFAVSWIVSRLPRIVHHTQKPERARQSGQEKIIEGKKRLR